MKALITGIEGFVGSHLAELLIRKGLKVGGIIYEKIPINISHIQKQIVPFRSDIRDRRKLNKVIKNFKPDQIYHLAAMSSVRDSLESPKVCFDINVMGTIALLDAVRASNHYPRLLLVGSGEEYGPSKPVPLTEDAPLNPITPYALSKLCMEKAGMMYYLAFSLSIIRVRSFNHTGPRQSTLGVCSDFARQIAEIEAGKREPLIMVGNLRARRDFSDVRDIVRGYWLAMKKGKSGGIYNLCSGKAYSINEILKILLSMSTKKITVRVRKERLRPLDIPVLKGSYIKAKKELGWTPVIPLRRTLEDLLHYWRKQILTNASKMM